MLIQILENWCIENNIPISEKQKSYFEIYAGMLEKKKKKMNLTSITQENEIAVKHFIDSISVIKYIDLHKEASLIDIGTGAGFPGIPIKIMYPDIKLTLLDSLNKRLIFLDEVCRKLDITAELKHGRAEEAGRDVNFREKYDIAVSRAVANLPALCEYCLPFVKVGGRFISMKGPDGENELATAEKAFNILGGNVENLFGTELPDSSRRTIISIKKISSTPDKYPRRGTKISKNPL